MPCGLKKILANISAIGLLTFVSTAFSGTIILPPGINSLEELLNQLPETIEEPISRFETVAIEIPNTTLTAGSIIPAGTPLKLVNLVTTHQNQIRLRTGNTVTYSIEGEIIATEVPTHRIIRLQTNVGRIAGIGFSLGENSYLLTQLNTPIEGVNRIVDNSTANTGKIRSINEIEHGFVPLNTEPVFGQAFTEVYYGSSFRGASVAPMVLYDADGLRGTAANLREELLFSDLQGETTNRPLKVLRIERETEVEAVVVFNDGSSSNILATRFIANFNYARNTRTYLFDTEALAVIGKTIEDIAQVTSFTSVNHNLSWAQLGFANAERNNNPSANINENKPPVAKNDRYTVSITRSINVTVDKGVLANDQDTRGDILTARLTSQTSNGILIFLNNGAFSYTPDYSYSGKDSFTYSVFDGEASSTATVTIDVQNNITPVNVENIKTWTKKISQERWRAYARITVFDENEKRVSGARISVTLSSNGTRIGVRSCTTNKQGKCRVSTSRLSKNTSDVVFTVRNINSESGAKGYQLDSSQNNNKTTTTVLRPS